jgi:hypothetical protein
MSEEQAAPVEQSTDNVQLQAELDAMRRKNAELLDEYKKAKAQAKAVPDGVDIQELLDFKAKAEQADLEKQGKYTEARQALEHQFREAAEEKDKRIAELTERVRELELIAPANTALADVVHDPAIVFKAQLLNPNQIEREPDGTVVVVNGYERKPINEWAKTLPSYMQKAPKPVGSGAPTGRSTGGDIPPGTKNPFVKGSPDYNITEQARLFRTNREMYERLKAAANR